MKTQTLLDKKNNPRLLNQIIEDEEAGKYVVGAGLGLSTLEKEKELRKKHVFGILIRLLREREGISAQELAFKAGVSRDQIKLVELESGYDNCPPDEVVKGLATYFKLNRRNCVELMTGMDKKYECTELDGNIEQFLDGIVWLSKKEEALDKFFAQINKCGDCGVKREKA